MSTQNIVNKVDQADEATLTIGLAGLGTVGSGLVAMLAENEAEILRRTGKRIVLKTVAVRDTAKARTLPTGTTTTADALSLAHDPNIQVVVELMGGTGLARELITAALKNGKSVVTANKALLAEHGVELFRLAGAQKLALAYEASVTGAIPIVQTLRESLAGNSMVALMGILNGTANYILSEMTSHGLDFPTALQEAQNQGIAEADPTLDIGGFDAAHKLALLIRLAWGVHYPYEKLNIQGIRNVRRMDIEIAKEFGYTLKLIGQARRVGERIEAGVFPALVHHSTLLASVGGAYNAVRVEGNAAGSLFFHGLGAGSKPTASAVLGDVLAIARNGACNNTGFVEQDLPIANILPSEEAESPWYLRVMVRDHSGVLRDLAAAMALEGVSVAQAIQKEERPDGVPLIFMTHVTSAKAMHAAIAQMDKAGLLLCPATCYRVLGK